MPHTLRIPLKFSKPLKVDFDSGATTVSLGAILLVVRPSWGNAGATTSTIAPVTEKNKSTGINMYVATTSWFTC